MTFKGYLERSEFEITFLAFIDRIFFYRLSVECQILKIIGFKNKSFPHENTIIFNISIKT